MYFRQSPSLNLASSCGGVLASKLHLGPTLLRQRSWDLIILQSLLPTDVLEEPKPPGSISYFLGKVAPTAQQQSSKDFRTGPKQITQKLGAESTGAEKEIDEKHAEQE